MAKKEDLTSEMHRLESEIESYGTAVSDAQIWHKRARIEQIKKELAELNSPANKFNAGTEKLNEMIKSDAKAFNDPNLLIKIYAMLSRYKCRQNLRRFIMILFENAIASPDIIDVAVKKMEGIGRNLFECVEGNEEGEEEKKRE